jgi:hypothetical protein
MGGIASVPFTDIWSKAIPSTLRGRFFGLWLREPRKYMNGVKPKIDST